MKGELRVNNSKGIHVPYHFVNLRLITLTIKCMSFCYQSGFAVALSLEKQNRPPTHGEMSSIVDKNFY